MRGLSDTGVTTDDVGKHGCSLHGKTGSTKEGGISGLPLSPKAAMPMSLRLVCGK